MIDRQKLETVLARRFPGAGMPQIASAANAIMGLEDEWEEVSTYDDFGYKVSDHCVESCSLAREAQMGTEFRVLRRKRWTPGDDEGVAPAASRLLVTKHVP